MMLVFLIQDNMLSSWLWADHKSEFTATQPMWGISHTE